MQKGFEIDMFGYEPEFVVCGDARIAYYDVGRGKPLVLLHGNGEDSSYWNAQIPELTRCYRVIAVDSRGHSASGSGVCIGAAGGLDLSRAERIRPAQGFCLHNSTWTRRHTSPLCSPQAAAYYRRTAFSSAFSVSRMLFTSSSAS